MADKSQLRVQLKGTRDALSPQYRSAQSQAACQRALNELASNNCVAVYDAIASELSVSTLVTALRNRGTTVVYPRVQASTRVLDFCVVSTLSDLAPGTLGILEPVPHLASVSLPSIDAFIVPALAFDPSGQRLGWGRGHYDYTLAQCPLATRVGICFQQQIVDSLPCEPTDERMDIVVTDTSRYQGEPRILPGNSREEA